MCLCVFLHVWICTHMYMSRCEHVSAYIHTHAVSEVHTDQDGSVYYFKRFFSAQSPDTICASPTLKRTSYTSTLVTSGGLRKYWTENYTRSHLKWFIVCIHIRTKVLCTQHRVLGKIQMTMTSWENKKRQTQNFPSSTYFQHQWHLLFSPRSTRLCTEVKVFFLHYSWRKHKHRHR